MAASPQRRAAAARVRRNGGTQVQAAAAAKISLRQYKRWEQEDDYKNLIHGRGVLQAGPLTIVADHDAVIDTDSELSLLWVAVGRTSTEGVYTPPEVLGTLAVADAKLCRAVFIMPGDIAPVRSQLEAGIFPITDNARTAVLPTCALQALQDEDELRSVCRLFAAPQRQAFDEWLKVWKYRNAEQKAVMTLDALWPGQEILADALCTNPHNFYLKARKLGATEISLAYAGFVARVRDVNARVALYSYRERAANALLAQVAFGLNNLPVHLRLPLYKEATLKHLEYDSGTDDVRSISAYPTSAASSIEQSSTHAMVDEFAHMPNNEQIFGALEPTFTAPGATSELLTTGVGPADWSAEYWRQCKDGDGLHVPTFVPATARPDRDEAWLQAKRKTMSRAAFRTEYALEESDALSGQQGFYFQGEDIDRITSSMPGIEVLRRADQAKAASKHRKADRLSGYRLITGVDIGVKDATVLTTLLLTRDGIMIVVNFERYTGLTYPEIQNRIDAHARMFPTTTLAIESNSMGITVIQNLKTATYRIIPFATTALSKAQAIEGLSSALENATLFAHEPDCAQLFRELRDYQIPDTWVQQDCVMSIAIAIACLPKLLLQGRLLTPFQA